MNVKLVISPRGSATLEILSGSLRGLTNALPEIRSTLTAVRKEFYHTKRVVGLRRMSKATQQLYNLAHATGWCDLHHRGFPKGERCLVCVKDKEKTKIRKRKEAEEVEKVSF